jgi:hypothetical protein
MMGTAVQGSLLLIYTLHVDLALQLVAGGKSVAKSHPYAGSKLSAAIDTALKEWWRDGAPAEAPVLLAWAAFQIFLASEGELLDFKLSVGHKKGMKEWWRDGAPAEAPVLLAWAAFQIFLAFEGELLCCFCSLLLSR